MLREKLWLPDDKLVVGSGTVELFDERTGRLYRREKFENQLLPAMLAYQKWQVRSDFSKNYPGTILDAAPGYPMTHLAIWNDATPENPVDQFPRGAFLSWCAKSAFGGGDPQRGAINLAESVQSPTAMTWVFDYPTTSSNGTFQSVGWVALDAANYGAVDVANQEATMLARRISNDSSTVVTSATDAYGYDPATDKMYAQRVLAVTEVNPGTLVAVGSTLFSVTNETGMTFDPTGTPGLWFSSTSTSTNPCLVKRNLAGVAIAQVNKSWTTILGSATTPDGHLAFDGTDLWTFKGLVLYRINTSTGAVATYDLAALNPGEFPRPLAGIGADSKGLLLSAYSGFQGSNPSQTGTFLLYRVSLTGQFQTKYVWTESGSGSNTNRMPYGSLVYRTATDRYWMSNRYMSNGATYMAPFDLNSSMATRALLGAPVTKDISKSMKITYIFQYV